MHPLFIAHLVADFLLQPKWLAEWKEKKNAGIAVHAAIHGVVMALFILPNTLNAALAILGITLLHGIVDSLKIKYQTKMKEPDFPFMLDQIIHWGVLAAAIFYAPLPALQFWSSEAGLGILILLAFYSFVLAWWNLYNSKLYRPTNWPERIKLFAMLAATFSLFFAGSIALPRLLAASSCF